MSAVIAIIIISLVLAALLTAAFSKRSKKEEPGIDVLHENVSSLMGDNTRRNNKRS